MTFREKSAWALASIVVVAFGWYLTTVVAQFDGSSVASISYQRSALIAAIATVVLVAGSHIVLAATANSTHHDDGSAAIRRYARSTGGVVVTAAAVLGMALAMAEADYFWIANVILAGLVASELASAGSEIVIYRRGA